MKLISKTRLKTAFQGRLHISQGPMCYRDFLGQAAIWLFGQGFWPLTAVKIKYKIKRSGVVGYFRDNWVNVTAADVLTTRSSMAKVLPVNK